MIAILKEYTLPQLREMTISYFGKPIEEMTRREIALHLSGTAGAPMVEAYASGNLDREKAFLENVKYDTEECAEMVLYIINDNMQSVNFLFE